MDEWKVEEIFKKSISEEYFRQQDNTNKANVIKLKEITSIYLQFLLRKIILD